MLRLLEATWVDPDTHENYRTTESLYSEDSRKYELVFSDEFEQDGRKFRDGDDPRWTAIHKNDCEYTLYFIYSKTKVLKKRASGGIIELMTSVERKTSSDNVWN